MLKRSRFVALHKIVDFDVVSRLKADFDSAMEGMKMHLARKSEPNGLFYIGELLGATSFSPKMVCYIV
jgi:hypothetical protein